jgi:maltodextrin utilization protein YvdJ
MEEIGWKSIFDCELRKVFSFLGVALFRVFFWASWHLPLPLHFSNNIKL